MKNLFLIIIASILFSSCDFLQGQNKEIEQFVKKVIVNYNDKNSEKFNQLIYKNTGLIFIITKGTNNNWEKVQSVCLNKKCVKEDLASSLEISYQSFLENYKTENLNLNKIEFTEKSYFECEKIDKKGIFVSSENKYHTLSESVNLFIENYPNIIGQELDLKKKIELQKKFQKFQKIELNSRRVTVNSNAGTFVFYITNIDGKWYLTIIDFASMDCSV